MPFKAEAVANKILDLGTRDDVPISPMKLQKLLYFAHGWYAGCTGKILLDDPIEAWKWGPVVPSVYHEFKRFGAQPITGRACSFDVESGTEGAPLEMDRSDPDYEEALKYITIVWDVMKDMTAIRLADLSHLSGGPWQQTWSESGGLLRSVDIDQDEIRKYFKAIAERNTGTANKK